MPKIRRDSLDDYQPYKEKVPRRKNERREWRNNERTKERKDE